MNKDEFISLCSSRDTDELSRILNSKYPAEYRIIASILLEELDMFWEVKLSDKPVTRPDYVIYDHISLIDFLKAYQLAREINQELLPIITKYVQNNITKLICDFDGYVEKLDNTSSEILNDIISADDKTLFAIQLSIALGKKVLPKVTAVHSIEGQLSGHKIQYPHENLLRRCGEKLSQLELNFRSIASGQGLHRDRYILLLSPLDEALQALAGIHGPQIRVD